ncbi:MAG: hypothetical protein R3241_00125 [Rheinheimera sp.]|nr:hypothetical protein [Rheinheimera sp.]
MLKKIIVNVAIVVMSLLIIKPVAAADGKKIKEDRIVISPQCVFWICPPVAPIEPVLPGVER